MPRFVVKPGEPGALRDNLDVTSAEPLEETGLFVVDAPDPRSVLTNSQQIAWAAPTIEDAGQESYPSGEVSIRFEAPLDDADVDSFVKQHELELRRQNEFVPQQVVVAPTRERKTWLPDLIQSLNSERVVAKAWPNTLSRYRRR
jgi:hypothetical protein